MGYLTHAPIAHELHRGPRKVLLRADQGEESGGAVQDRWVQRVRPAGLLLENGDEIVQLTFVDHFLMLFASPLHDFNTTPGWFEEVRPSSNSQFPTTLRIAP